MGKILDALKRKYRTPREAVIALGLDSRDLDADLMAGDSANDAEVVGGRRSKENDDMAIKSRTELLSTFALASFLRPKLAQDATVNLRPILRGVTAENYAQRRPKILKDLRTALKGKLAKDASIGEVAELLDQIGAHGGGEKDDQEVPQKLGKEGEKVGAKFAEKDSMDAEPLAAVLEFLNGKLDESDLAKVADMLKGGGMHEHDGEDSTAEPDQERKDESEEWRRGEKDDEPATDEGNPEGGAKLKELGAETGEDDEEEYEAAKREGPGAKDQPPPFKGSPKVGGKMISGKDSKSSGMTKQAVDQAIQAAVQAERQTRKDIRDAERAVQPWVGQLTMNFDSAEQVFRHALKIMNVPGVDKVHPSALKTILDLQPLPGARRTVSPKGGNAMDAASVGSFNERFPELKRIRLT